MCMEEVKVGEDFSEKTNFDFFLNGTQAKLLRLRKHRF